MQLLDYLNEKKLTPTELARKAKISHSSITRYLSGEKNIGFKVMQKIATATNGAVTPNDFYHLPASSDSPLQNKTSSDHDKA